nr:bifunctional DNA primase/polymerase [Micromonospora sp. DSM 115978]
MWGRVRPPIGQLSTLDRMRLRRIAVRYAVHGWDVTPGASLTRHRFVCGRVGCHTTGCHPAMEDWETGASADPARVATWWRVRPHSVLLVTGRAFDVLEVPAYLGRAALDAIESATGQASGRRSGDGPAPPLDRRRGPVAVTPGGRWMFLVRPGEPLRPELDQCLYVVRHGAGSWIPAPPTRLPEGTVRWVVPPEETRWTLAHPHPLQDLLVETLYGITPALARPLARPLVPAQLPAPRQGGY